MELDVLAFGETLIAQIPVLRREAASLTPEPETAHRLVRATVAKAWQDRPAHSEYGDIRTWLGDLMRREHADKARFGEPRSFMPPAQA
jgi:DNA-directed RNA polymerase specialized sigma24 family protein